MKLLPQKECACACVSFKHSITISRSNNNIVEERRKNLMKIINKVRAIPGRAGDLGAFWGLEM